MPTLRERAAAAVADVLGRRFEERFAAEKRRSVLRSARGRVLEIGVGTGLSFGHYPDAVTEIVALEPHAGMRARAERRAGESGRPVGVVDGSAEQLPFADASFDTVVSMLVLCTVEDPARALAEIRRVLRPDGTFLFVEHVRSDHPARARWQDRLERPWGMVAGGCHPNRDTVATIRGAGFDTTMVDEGEMPMVPPIAKPYVVGRATGVS